tara:strand:+ start:385 stop:642 length:258 start_codon:yes stop_codon:yes gene_type:complete
MCLVFVMLVMQDRRGRRGRELAEIIEMRIQDSRRRKNSVFYLFSPYFYSYKSLRFRHSIFDHVDCWEEDDGDLEMTVCRTVDGRE